MKKELLKLYAIALIVLVTAQSCSNTDVPLADTTVEYTSKVDASEIEFIVNSINNAPYISERAPGWWVRFKKWVKAHTGRSQIYVNGQPVCGGGYPCGPCPGICFKLGIQPGDGNGGDISAEEHAEGIRSFELALVENAENERKILIRIRNDHNDLIVNNSYVKIDELEVLPDRISHDFGFHSISLLPGEYPVFESSQGEAVETVVNAIFN